MSHSLPDQHQESTDQSHSESVGYRGTLSDSLARARRTMFRLRFSGWGALWEARPSPSGQGLLLELEVGQVLRAVSQRQYEHSTGVGPLLLCLPAKDELVGYVVVVQPR